MKVLILANNDIGLYKFRKELMMRLLDRNDEVFFSVPEGDMVKPLIEMGCKFIGTPMDRRGTNIINDSKLLWQYIGIIKEIEPDYVITYTIKPNIYGGMACRLLKRSYAINITGLGSAFHKRGLLNKFVVALYKLACKSAKVVFFENAVNKDTFLECGIVSENKTCVLNGAGVNLNEYGFCEYPNSENEIRFLFIGRIMKEKGIGELLEATKKLRENRYNVYLDVVGPYEETNYEEIIRAYQEEGIVFEHGYQEDIRPFVRKSHCFVLPSYHEGMANTILEAGAMGRPLIVSDIPGCREGVIDGEGGFLCKPQDAMSLYDKMQKFTELSYEKKKEMGRLANEYITKKFDKNKVVDATLTAMFSK